MVRRFVDCAIYLICGHLLLQQGVTKQPQWQDAFNEVKPSDNGDAGVSSYEQMRLRKQVVARRYITSNAGLIDTFCEQITTGDRTTMTDYDEIVGPVPIG